MSITVVPAAAAEIATLRISRKLNAGAFNVSAAPCVAFAVTGVPFTLYVAPTDAACDDAPLNELSTAIAAQLRVVSILVPLMPSVDGPLLTPLPYEVVPIFLDSTANLPGMIPQEGLEPGDTATIAARKEQVRQILGRIRPRRVWSAQLARVVINLPLAPLPALLGGGGSSQWALRICGISIGGVPIAIGELATRAFPVIARPLPGPVRPPGPLHAACTRGDLAAVRHIISPRLPLAWFSTDYSTEETDEVRGVELCCHWVWYRDSVIRLRVSVIPLQHGVTCLLAALSHLGSNNDRDSIAALLTDMGARAAPSNVSDFKAAGVSLNVFFVQG